MQFTTFAVRAGLAFSAAQHALARVAYDGAEPRDLVGTDRELARRIFGDVETISSGARSTVAIVAGARSGKSSRLGALRLLHLALTVELKLAPGELAVGIIVAPDLRLARQAFRFAIGAAKKMRGVFVGATSDALTVRRVDGIEVTIEALPATRGGSAVRGRTLVGALLDEVAFFRDADSVVNDSDLYRAIAPRVVPGGQTILASTPWAESGLLYDLHSHNFGKPTRALVAHAPTILMRPTLGAVVEAERERDPMNAAREFDAVFVSAGSSLFFDPDSLRDCIDRARTGFLQPERSMRAICAADFGFTADFTGAAVLRLTKERRIEVAEWLEIKPAKGAPLRPSEVCKRVADLARRHGITSLVADAHYRESVREHLSAERIAFISAPGGLQGKIDTYRRAANAVGERRVALPNHPRLLEQLRAVHVRPLPGGGISISHPRRRGSGHGDLAAAVVLGVSQLSRSMRSTGVHSGAPLESASADRGDGIPHLEVSASGGLRWNATPGRSESMASQLARSGF